MEGGMWILTITPFHNVIVIEVIQARGGSAKNPDRTVHLRYEALAAEGKGAPAGDGHDDQHQSRAE